MEPGIIEFLRKYKWRILLGIFGLATAILFLTLGFFGTLLIVLLVGACYFVGMLLDKHGRGSISRFIRQIFKSGDDNHSSNSSGSWFG